VYWKNELKEAWGWNVPLREKIKISKLKWAGQAV